jgi:hypothetical protein
MKKVFFCMVAGTMILFACNKPAKQETGVAADDSTKHACCMAKKDSASCCASKAAVQIADDISIAFDKAADTAELNFKGETATLKGDSVASGIQYSNDVFKYVEHHGETIITKKGEVVFKKGEDVVPK